MSLRRSSYGETEQGREHPGGQFDGNLLHPVERFAHGQALENVDDALAYEGLKFGQVTRCKGGCHGHPLRPVFRLVQADETLAHDRLLLGRLRQVHNRDAALLRRKHAVVRVHLLDQAVARDRPERPVRAVRKIVHGRFLSQPCEPRPPGIVPVEIRAADVDFLQGNAVRPPGFIYMHRLLPLAVPRDRRASVVYAEVKPIRECRATPCFTRDALAPQQPERGCPPRAVRQRTIFPRHALWLGRPHRRIPA